MVDAKFHFGTMRYLFIMYTMLFTYVAHYLQGYYGLIAEKNLNSLVIA